MQSKRVQHVAQLKLRRDVVETFELERTGHKSTTALDGEREREKLKKQQAMQSADWWSYERYRGVDQDLHRFLATSNGDPLEVR